MALTAHFRRLLMGGRRLGIMNRKDLVGSVTGAACGGHVQSPDKQAMTMNAVHISLHQFWRVIMTLATGSRLVNRTDA